MTKKTGCEILTDSLEDVEVGYQNGDKTETPAAKSNAASRCQLAILVTVAVLALTSIVLFAEQLLVRHLASPDQTLAELFMESNKPHHVQEEISLVQLEDWAHRETIQFDDNVISIRAIEKISLPPPPPPSPRAPLIRQRPLMEVSEDGIYWSRRLEAMSPPGLPAIQVQDEMQQLRGKTVAKLDHPDWLHCGRDQNRYVTFTDGTNACMRNRGPKHKELVQGEVMAFYLARILGLANTPVVVLSQTSSRQWSQGEMKNPSSDIVALIQWIPRLTKTPIPGTMLDQLLGERSGPLSASSSANIDPEDLADMVQWSDLVIFDYLTGNYDRIASMMDGADNDDSVLPLRETVHNLGQSLKTGSLWMLDNESSFLDAYAQMYADPSDTSGQKFVRYHDQILQTFCLFRRRTVERVQALAEAQHPDQILLEFVSRSEPLFQQLPQIHRNSLFSKHFKTRLNKLVQWFDTCRNL